MLTIPLSLYISRGEVFARLKVTDICTTFKHTSVRETGAVHSSRHLTSNYSVALFLTKVHRVRDKLIYFNICANFSNFYAKSLTESCFE